MICFPNCKINLGLNVVEKRNDGFHNIETIFYPISLCDALEIIESKKLAIEFSGLKIDGNPEENLCMKAYRLISEIHKIPPVKIFLHKVVPTGAGLGGGSADAAFMLQLLNNYFELNISEKKLMHLASKLGSDCCFFIKNTAVFAYGRGEKTENISLDLKGKNIIIVKPDFSVPTAKAYSLIKPKTPFFSLRNIGQKKITGWKKIVVNDFESPVSKEFPEVIQIKEMLYKAGAVYASMTGSGSAVYGIFDSEPDIPSAYNKYFTWKGSL